MICYPNCLVFSDRISMPWPSAHCLCLRLCLGPLAHLWLCLLPGPCSSLSASHQNPLWVCMLERGARRSFIEVALSPCPSALISVGPERTQHCSVEGGAGLGLVPRCFKAAVWCHSFPAAIEKSDGHVQIYWCLHVSQNWGVRQSPLAWF